MKNIHIKNLKCFMIFTMLFTSCMELKVPRPIYYCQLENKEEADWKNGEGIIYKDVDTSISTYLYYDRSDMTYHYFKFGIWNKGSEKFNFDPANIYVSGLQFNQQPFYSSIVDPEDYIQFLKYKGEIEQTEAMNRVISAHNTSVVLGVTLIGVALAAATIATVEENKKAKQEKSSATSNGIFTPRQQRMANRRLCNNSLFHLPPPVVVSSPNLAEIQSAKIEESKVNQAKEEEKVATFFRMNTFLPGDINEGYIMMPIDQKIEKTFYLNIPITSDTIQYQFNQIIYSPKQ